MAEQALLVEAVVGDHAGICGLLACGHYAGPFDEGSPVWGAPERPHVCPNGCGMKQFAPQLQSELRARLSPGGAAGEPGPAGGTGKQRFYRAVCATCLRPLDVWPDAVRHQDARFDIDGFPFHHEAVELRVGTIAERAPSVVLADLALVPWRPVWPWEVAHQA